jgi:hypothetical protein
MLDGTISRSQLSELVQLSRAIAESHLSYLRPSITRLCLNQGLTITDLAYDCIAEAFARSNNNSFPLIEKFVSHLTGKLADLPELELFLAFKGFLTRLADAQLARLYAQADPAGAKIHRNIRDCVKASSIFILERDFRGLILRPRAQDSLDHLDSFPMESLEREFLSRASGERSTPGLLEILYQVLIEQSQYRRSIPLVDAVQLLKRVYGYESELLASTDTLPSCEGLNEFEIEQIRSQVEFALKERILLTYFARGKVDRKEAEAMFCAFHDMLSDWCCSGDPEASVCEYLRRHLSISEEAYETSFRAKMEYLLKIAREEFAARLLREL